MFNAWWRPKDTGERWPPDAPRQKRPMIQGEVHCCKCHGERNVLSTDIYRGAWRCIFCQNWWCFHCGVEHFRVSHSEATAHPTAGSP